MPENKTKPYGSSDDIDLISLLERAYLFFRRFRITFLVAIIAGIILGCAGYFLSPKMYQSKLILHATYLTNQEELEIIDYWNQLLKRNDRKLLAPILSCGEDLLDHVISFDGDQILKNYASNDPNGFYINVKVTDNSVLPSLQNAIVYGLSNTDYVKDKAAQKREYLQELIGQAAAEVRRLDSLKNSIETGLGKNPAAALYNVQTINKDRVDMNEKLAGYRTDLNSLSSLQVLQGFIPLNTPVSRSLKTSIALGLLVSIAAAYLFSVLKYIEDRLKKRAKDDA